MAVVPRKQPLTSRQSECLVWVVCGQLGAAVVGQLRLFGAREDARMSSRRGPYLSSEGGLR